MLFAAAAWGCGWWSRCRPFWLGLLLGSGLAGLAQPYGLSNRVANTSLRLPDRLQNSEYTTTNAFGSLLFDWPVAMVSPPGETNRLFVVEQPGRICVVTNLAAPNRTVFLDISDRVRFGAGGESGLLALAFHPGYVTNRQFYVWYTLYTNQSIGAATRHDRLARFQADSTDPARALPETELVLINQRDEAENHNGGELLFGPDGYLYLSLGDEGGAVDVYDNSQRIDKDFFSGIIRIDVDQRSGSLPPHPHPANQAGGTIHYAIPPDNPFVGVTSFNGVVLDPAAVRTEFWAVGLRNPWRMAFDSLTGLLYCADVGQGSWEEINLISKGGNYGWAYSEGLYQPGPPPPGIVWTDPIQKYPHGTGPMEGNCVIGGLVYRGDRYPDLVGDYLFADYLSGNIWTSRYQVSGGATNITPFTRIASDTGIASFAIDPSTGDILLADQSENTVKRLVRVATSDAALPSTLAEAGVFSNLVNLTPQPGIVPYAINVPFWTDGALKSRWFCIPNATDTITFNDAGPWAFPTGTVWIKHFELELTNGVPASRRRLETRLLVRDHTTTGVYGVTYRWGAALTNALLVKDGGLDEDFSVYDGTTVRTQRWHYPARSECLICHGYRGGQALGFITPQLNRDLNYGGTTDNQLRALNHAGYFQPAISNLNRFPVMAAPTNAAVSLEWRARSWLMANCAYCHYPGGIGGGGFDLEIYRPLSSLNLINGSLTDDLGNSNHRVVKPGSIGESVLLTRITSTNLSLHMPPLASRLVDPQAVQVLTAWITNGLQGYQSFGEWQLDWFGDTNAPAAGALADTDHDRAPNWLEYLTATDPTDPLACFQLSAKRNGDNLVLEFLQTANRGYEVQWNPSLDGGSEWRCLDIPSNQPFFAPTNRLRSVDVTVSERPATYYRVRVYEP